MLDLGFLEDVERILTITPNSRQTALFSATMPPPIRALADRYLYDPVTVKVKSATLTVDSVEQFSRRREVRRQGREARRRAARRAPRPGHRLHAHEDPLRPALPPAARPRPERQGAARRHVPGPARRRHARLQGRPRCRSSWPPTSPPAAWTSRRSPTSSTSTCPTSPDVYVHRIGRTGRVGRAGRAITFVEPRQQRELAAIERHIGTGITPWAEGAHTTPAPVAERPRRHSKPHISRDGDEPQAKLVAGVGRAEGVEVADLVHAVTSAAGHRRRGGARRARARALLLPQRPAQRGRARRRRGQRHAGQRHHAAPRDRARLSAHASATARSALRVALSVCNPGHVKLLEAEPVLAPEARSGGPTREPAGAAGEPTRGRPHLPRRAARRWRPSRTGA